MVERGEFARQVIRFIVGCRNGRNQTNMAGDGRQRGQQRQWLEMRDARHAAEAIVVARPHADRIGEEQGVETAALRGLRQGGVVAEIDAGIGLRLRVPPCAIW